MNLVIITGNLVRDPEKSVAGSGMSIVRFTVAVNRFRKNADGSDADFIRVTVFDRQADLVAQYLRKGSKVGVEGRLQTGSYEKDGKTVYTTDVIGNRVEFLDRKGEGGGGADRESYPSPIPSAPPAAQPSALPPGFGIEDDDEDMPF
ncbi:MAG: single-stranded DNA-binding protein [Clostridiales Family XIII bacterium]|jgi:single-strand DNA-binding protein|nr:single-stranded DNA-binding protein [Clostridiales Family XIII bacterium]